MAPFLPFSCCTLAPWVCTLLLPTPNDSLLFVWLNAVAPKAEGSSGNTVPIISLIPILAAALLAEGLLLLHLHHVGLAWGVVHLVVKLGKDTSYMMYCMKGKFQTAIGSSNWPEREQKGTLDPDPSRIGKGKRSHGVEDEPGTDPLTPWLDDQDAGTWCDPEEDALLMLFKKVPVTNTFPPDVALPAPPETDLLRAAEQLNRAWLGIIAATQAGPSGTPLTPEVTFEQEVRKYETQLETQPSSSQVSREHAARYGAATSNSITGHNH
ncbi:hypothetical protein VOLCADRAFT_89657 [Volvox carteri f. nagariensis]|uniref:Uncharacterized protein n=1 Tax=Volvox carteri f. nagariensis TaxID=3068 RepID=D8TSF5_VOLCA|nr:uncharacterized protein VOLCADRAFT_89657 [Volvox carteri f. nagariensis]EFJ49689.1 hypothetical protein VOLCADRAFT_89657 [Volvox carteri f. nagariensis]|eukprot:XP_002949196.1 hypothetical protein VOLCADRAFT_89657 [Volvox carteri f. nagariensis]